MTDCLNAFVFQHLMMLFPSKRHFCKVNIFERNMLLEMLALLSILCPKAKYLAGEL